MANARLRAVFMRGGTSKAVMFRRDDLPAEPDGLGSDLPAGDGLARSERPATRRHGRRHLLAVEDLHHRSAEPAGRRCRLHLCADRRARHLCRLRRQLRQHVFGGRAVRARRRAGDGARPTAKPRSASTTPIPRRSSSRAFRSSRARWLRPATSRSTASPARRRRSGWSFSSPAARGPASCCRPDNAVDELDIKGLGRVKASCVDAANPCVFVAASAVGQSGDELPDVLDRDAVFLQHMEAIRCAASVKMGIAPDLEQATRMTGIPKVAMVSGPRAGRTLSGRELSASRCRHLGPHDLGRPAASRHADHRRDLSLRRDRGCPAAFPRS